MARQARLESETGYYHVMIRGINRENIFQTEQEKEKILTLVKEKTQEEPCKIVAYCIMNNHLHMIIHAEKAILVRVMKRINISYAMSYNQRNKRIGPVFQDRFRSENIETEKYLFGAIRYIHNNPVQAGITTKAQEYKWSSMREYIDNVKLLIDKETKEGLLKEFISIDDFKNFHEIEDETDYLEIKEEVRELKTNKAQKVIEEYFSKKGIADARQLKNRDELIIKLLDETGLSYRKIAELTGITVSMVHQANKKYRP
ncbi:MAG: REP-associated tyrosine transposase [Peptococcales bacterium]|jgi:putative transposase